jgi:hypothetical protein
MDVETAIQAFVSAGNNLPREAMQWTLDHWHTVAPELLSVVERYTSGADRSDETASAVFFILHLAGEKQDTRVFPLLCRLAQDGEAIEAALGDGTTTTFKRILISTYDGDLDALIGLIEAAEADQFVRAGALQVLAYLTATGRIPRDETEAYLLRLYDTLQPQHESFVWSGWVLAIALLGLEAFSGVVRQAFGRGLIEPMVMNYDNFRRDLARTLADPERMAGFRYDRLEPLEDAIGELSSWYGFSDAAKRDQERRATSPGDARLTFADVPQSSVDPFKLNLNTAERQVSDRLQEFRKFRRAWHYASACRGAWVGRAARCRFAVAGSPGSEVAERCRSPAGGLRHSHRPVCARSMSCRRSRWWRAANGRGRAARRPTPDGSRPCGSARPAPCAG